MWALFMLGCVGSPVDDTTTDEGTDRPTTPPTDVTDTGTAGEPDTWVLEVPQPLELREQPGVVGQLVFVGSIQNRAFFTGALTTPGDLVVGEYPLGVTDVPGEGTVMALAIIDPTLTTRSYVIDDERGQVEGAAFIDALDRDALLVSAHWSGEATILDDEENPVGTTTIEGEFTDLPFTITPL